MVFPWQPLSMHIVSCKNSNELGWIFSSKTEYIVWFKRLAPVSARKPDVRKISRLQKSGKLSEFLSNGWKSCGCLQINHLTAVSKWFTGVLFIRTWNSTVYLKQHGVGHLLSASLSCAANWFLNRNHLSSVISQIAFVRIWHQVAITVPWN